MPARDALDRRLDREPGQVAHRADRGHARDRVVGERPGEGDRAGEPIADEHRAAAHAGDHAALLEPLTGQSSEDEAGVGMHVAHDAEDLDVEAHRLGAGEHGEAVALGAALDRVDRELGRVLGRGGFVVAAGFGCRGRRGGRRRPLARGRRRRSPGSRTHRGGGTGSLDGGSSPVASRCVGCAWDPAVDRVGNVPRVEPESRRPPIVPGSTEAHRATFRRR